MGIRRIARRSAAALLLAVCAAGFVAVPGAAPATDPGAGALIAGGIRIIVRAGAWTADPADLDLEVTPMFLAIENRSRVPLRVRHEEFALVARRGSRFAALSPSDIRGTVTEHVRQPGLPYAGFRAAPFLAPYYSDAPLFQGAFPFDGDYYGVFSAEVRQVRLPTTAMTRLALPEGVVTSGGRVSGFLYFERLGRGAGTVSLVAELVDAISGATLGPIAIPLSTSPAGARTDR